jgi:hypothetical protein
MNEMGKTNPVAKNDSQDRRLIMRVLGHKHMIETIERFEWKNLPPEIPSDLIERILYYRFKGAIFKFNERYLFLPFTLKGTIDSYGRYNTISPVLFTGQWKISGDGKIEKDIAFISGQEFTTVSDLPKKKETTDPDSENQDSEEMTKVVASGIENAKTKAVILTDSTLEIAQDFTPMAYLIRPFVEQLTDILVLVNIDLITSAKVFYVVAKDEAQKTSIENEFAHLDRKILQGKRIVVVTSATELKELNGNSAKDTARYFQSYQSIDNLRKDIIGGDNGGTFMKQEHTTEMETETNSNGGSGVMNNALKMRQEFCLIANYVFGLNISVDIKGSGDSNSVAPEGSQTKDRKDDDQ